MLQRKLSEDVAAGGYRKRRRERPVRERRREFSGDIAAGECREGGKGPCWRGLSEDIAAGGIKAESGKGLYWRESFLGMQRSALRGG